MLPGDAERLTPLPILRPYHDPLFVDINNGNFDRVQSTLMSAVRFVNYRAKPRPLMVMEYLPLGNLHDAHYACKLELDETWTVLWQALLALEYMKSHGFINRDIKPANILLSSRYPLFIKLADLGGAKHDRDGSTKFQTWIGTYLYASPEMYEWEEKPYTFAVDIWSLGIVVLDLTCGHPEPGSGKFNPAEWFPKIFEFIQGPNSNELIDFMSKHMLLVEPEKRLSASECLQEMPSLKLALGIERALQSPSPSQASQIDLGTPTEKASMVTTLMWGSNNKRQRSPDSSCHASFSKKATVRKVRDDHNTSSGPQNFPIAIASLWFDGQRGPIYESVLKLLKDIQIGGDEATDSHTSALVQKLCRKFKRLEITEVIKSIDQDAERTILTAVTEERVFELASLTSSNLANPVADLAHQLHQMMDLLDPNPETSSHDHDAVKYALSRLGYSGLVPTTDECTVTSPTIMASPSLTQPFSPTDKL